MDDKKLDDVIKKLHDESVDAVGETVKAKTLLKKTLSDTKQDSAKSGRILVDKVRSEKTKKTTSIKLTTSKDKIIDAVVRQKVETESIKNEAIDQNKTTEILSNKIKVTLQKSLIGCRRSHRACARGLGLRRREHTVEVLDTPANRGMINKISYLLKVE